MSKEWSWKKTIAVSVGLPVATYITVDQLTHGQLTRLVNAPKRCLESIGIDNTKCISAPFEKLVPPASNPVGGSGDLIEMADEINNIAPNFFRGLSHLYYGVLYTLTNMVNHIPGVHATPSDVESALPYVAGIAIVSIGMMGIRRMNIARNRYR